MTFLWRAIVEIQRWDEIRSQFDISAEDVYIVQSILEIVFKRYDRYYQLLIIIGQLSSHLLKASSSLQEVRWAKDPGEEEGDTMFLSVTMESNLDLRHAARIRFRFIASRLNAGRTVGYICDNNQILNAWVMVFEPFH